MLLFFQAKDRAERVGVPQEAKRCRSWWQIPLPASLQALLPQAASLSCFWASQVNYKAARVSPSIHPSITSFVLSLLCLVLVWWVHWTPVTLSLAVWICERCWRSTARTSASTSRPCAPTASSSSWPSSCSNGATSCTPTSSRTTSWYDENARLRRAGWSDLFQKKKKQACASNFCLYCSTAGQWVQDHPEALWFWLRLSCCWQWHHSLSG